MNNPINIKIDPKKIMSIMVLLSFGFTANAAGTENQFYSNFPFYLILVAAAIVIFSALIAIYRLLNLMVRMKELEIYGEHGIEEYLAKKKANEGNWWQRMNRQLTGAVPIEKESDIMMDHNYDGIRELDNNLPPWWLYGFYLTIAISVVYMGYYHFSSNAKSSAELYEIEMAEAQEAVDLYLSKQSDLVDETNVVTLTDENSLALGKEIFQLSCVACHLDHGGGGPASIGPNLTDEYWIHGGSIVDLFSTIKYGVPEKGMISWKDQLRPADMQNVASYILSLQGTNPPNAKEPQGELYVPEVNVPVDTSNVDPSEK